MAPSNLEASAAGYMLDISICNTTVDLSWQDNSNDEAGFRIQRRTGIAGQWQVIGEVRTDIDSYRDSGLEPRETYFYRVSAFDGRLKSDYSNEASATTN